MAELHGTGTALGDPIEVGALRGVMKRLSLHSVLSRVFFERDVRCPGIGKSQS